MRTKNEITISMKAIVMLLTLKLDRLKDRAPSQELEERKQNAQVDQPKSESSDDNNQGQLTPKKKTKPEAANTSQKRKRESDVQVEPKPEKQPKVNKKFS